MLLSREFNSARRWCAVTSAPIDLETAALTSNESRTTTSVGDEGIVRGRLHCNARHRDP